MDKRNNVPRTYQRGVKEEEEVLEVEELESQEDQSPSFVPLRLRINARYVTYGSVSGNKYEFNGAGSIVSVLEEDVPAFLAKKTNASCCGTQAKAQNILEVVGE